MEPTSALDQDVGAWLTTSGSATDLLSDLEQVTRRLSLIQNITKFPPSTNTCGEENILDEFLEK